MRTKTNRNCLRLCITACLVLLFLPVNQRWSAGAQEPQNDQVRLARSGSNSVIVASKDDYLIGISDVLMVTVDKAPELSRNVRVSSKGTIPMPYLGSVPAAGKSPEELGKLIADGLRGRYLREPIVTIEVKQCNSRAFFVQGSVRSPGVYYIEGRVTLYQLITIAGGLEKDHGSTAFVLRQKGRLDPVIEAAPASTEHTELRDQPNAASDTDAVEDYEAIAVNINALMNGHFEKNMMIQPGDLVQIPQTELFFVGGEVKAPGQFPLRPGTTLRQAIALAQGTTFNAAKSRGSIFRENRTTGQNEELHVDIGAVMNGKGEDIPIRPNDVIIVPNSRLKSVGGGLLKAFGLSFATIRYY